MSREGKLVKNTLILSIGTFLPKAVSFITLPILTGYLTKTEYGTYDLITVLVSLVLPAATLQIQAAAFRFLIDVRGKYDEEKKIVTNIFCFVVPMSMIALVILYFCLRNIDPLIRILLCLFLLADIGENASRQICRGLDNAKDYSISAIISSVAKMLCIVIFVYFMRAGLVGTVAALLTSSVFGFGYIFFKTRLYRYIDRRSFDRALLKEMLGYSWPMVPNSISAWVMRLSDRLVVVAFMGLPTYAVYAVANKIPSLLNLAQNTFTLAWQENASIVSKDDDASEYYSSMFRTMFDLMAGFFGIIIASTPILFKILIRGDYGEAYYQMPILFVAMFFYSMSTFLGGIYVAYMKSKSVGVTTTMAAGLNLVTDLGFIKWIGLYAASGSTLISYVFLFVYRIIDVQKIVKIKYDKKHVILIIGIMIMESALCFMQKPVLNIINGLAGVIVFIILNKSLIRTATKKIKSVIKRKDR